MNRKRLSHLLPNNLRIIDSAFLSSADMCITYILHVMNEISPERAKIIEPVINPVDLKRMGMVRVAPPIIALKRPRTVVEEGFNRSAYKSLILITKLLNIY